MPLSRIFNTANMSFNAIREIKILAIFFRLTVPDGIRTCDFLMAVKYLKDLL